MCQVGLTTGEKNKLLEIAQRIHNYRQKYFSLHKYNLATLDQQCGNNLNGTLYVSYYIITLDQKHGCVEGDSFSKNLDLIAAKQQVTEYLTLSNKI